jgi:choline dehydrogenase-like flavoprotein/predicted dehydrogenase
VAIDDLRQLPDNCDLSTDVCIVGSGPAGLTLALQFIGSSTQICIVESGGLNRVPETDALSAFENVGLSRAPHEVARCRGFGGTSAIWTGRCGTFDEIDYQHRPWVPYSGWPILPSDLEPYLDQAGVLLGLGPAVYSDRIWELLGSCDRPPRWDPRNLLPTVWQFSKRADGMADSSESSVQLGPGPKGIAALQHAGAPVPTHFGDACRALCEQAHNVRVLLHANATNVQLDSSGARVNWVDVRSLEGRIARVSARTVVLCCGGIDNARLLLSSTSVNPLGVGNEHDVVGRFLMDHAYVPIATYDGIGDQRLRRRLGHRWFDRHGKRHVYQLGLRLNPSEQRQRGLLNSAIHIVEFGEKPSAIGAAGRVARAMRRRRPNELHFDDVRHVLTSPVSLMNGVLDRFLLHRPTLSVPERVEIGCIAEQLPNPQSRVTLSDRRDALGMHQAKIDWRASELEFQTICAMQSIVTSEIARLGYRAPASRPWAAEGYEKFSSSIHDFAHPVGTTRMSADPRKGVVDANCRVHGVEGLYVAGSSVFSTSGYTNPTLMIVALSLRLADHIKQRLAEASTATAARHVPLVTRRRARVGFVGAGHRIRTVYQPILAALHDAFEPVGFTTRTGQTAEAFSKETGIPAFSDPFMLVSREKPDFLIMAVSNESIEEALNQLLGLGVPILAETPIAWSLRKGRRILKRIARGQLMVGVAEQTPFLPAEQMKRRLADLGVIGEIIAAHNDFQTYDYHGIAQLRSYLGRGRLPKDVSAVQTRFATSYMNSTRPTQTEEEVWMLGNVVYDDGTALLHHYSPTYYRTPFRRPRSVRIYGTSGSLIDEEVIIDGIAGETQRLPITRLMNGNRLSSLTAQTPLGTVRWDNPFSKHCLSDEHIAVATLLERMKNAVFFGGLPAYTASEALTDIELLAAMRYSARLGGGRVKVPVKPLLEMVRVHASAAVSRRRAS